MSVCNHSAPSLELDGLKRALYGAAVIPLPFACALLYVADPADGGYPVCPFRAATGLFCPGCGTLRALARLLHLDPAGAVAYNPLAIAALPVMAYAVAWSASVAIRGRGIAKVFVPARWVWALFAVVVAFWLLRNVPVAPFDALAP